MIGFGLSSVEAELEGTSTAGAAMRWRAPELLPPMGADLYSFTPTLTLACDIYSFGSVTLQVRRLNPRLTAQQPYYVFARSSQASYHIPMSSPATVFYSPLPMAFSLAVQQT